jgi:hypothetical protein
MDTGRGAARAVLGSAPMPSLICTCCDSEVDELVTASRRDGSPQQVCRPCRDLVLGLVRWTVLYASTRQSREKPRGMEVS